MGLALKQVDGGNYWLNDFFISAAVPAGQAMVLETSAAAVGEAKAATTTTAADFIGCAMDAATFNATPLEEPSQVRQENLVRLAINSQIVWRFAVAGGATSGTPLQPSTATPANILVNDSADATGLVITDTAVGAISMAGGLVKGRLGRNVGALRKMTAWTTSVSQTVGLKFLNTIAIGDQFIRLPWSRSTMNVQLTTDMCWANGLIATGTGAPFTVVNVVIDEVRNRAWVDCVARDSFLSPESV